MVAAPSVLVGWQVPVGALPPALQADKINMKNMIANTRNHFLILPSSTNLTFSTHHSTADLWTGQQASQPPCNFVSKAYTIKFDHHTSNDLEIIRKTYDNISSTIIFNLQAM